MQQRQRVRTLMKTLIISMLLFTLTSSLVYAAFCVNHAESKRGSVSVAASCCTPSVAETTVCAKKQLEVFNVVFLFDGEGLKFSGIVPATLCYTLQVQGHASRYVASYGHVADVSAGIMALENACVR